MGLLQRLRESVATTQLPAVQRNGDTEIEESAPTQAERDQAVKDGDAFSDGSYPIKTQKQADNAWGLRNNSKDHSEDAVVSHIRQQVRKHDLTMPSSGDDKTRESLSLRVLLREAKVSKTDGGAYEATVVEEGPGNPGDRNYYTKQALQKAVREGKFDGLQAYADHPTASEERDRPERSVRHLVGHFREAKYVDGNPAHVRAKFVPVQGAGYEWVISLIESALNSVPGKPLVGISIDGYGHAPDQQDIKGRTYNMVREITHLGSADIVTRAGAGGQFHRRLQEAWRNTTDRPDGGGNETQGGPMKLKPAQLQDGIKAAVAKFTEAAGLDDKESEKADKLVDEAITALREHATAELELPEPEIKIQEKIVEKPVAADKDSDVDAITVKLQETERKLTEVTTERDAEKTARTEAEGKLAANDTGKLAAKVLREAKVPQTSAEAWFDDVCAAGNEDAMTSLVTRRMAERESIIAEFRETIGVEGAGPRNPAPAGSNGSGLLDQLGIDADELAAA